MFKWIVRDYFAAFRWGNIKEAMKNGGVFLIIYWGCLLPSIAGFIERKEYLLTYVLIIVPTAFTALSGKLHSMNLSKVMYLCPIGRKERREYIVKSCYFRIGLTAMVSILAVLILVCVGLCDWVTSIGLMFNGIVFALLMCGIEKKKSITEKEPYPPIEMNRQGVIEVVDVFFTLISSYGIACLLCWDTPVSWWVKYIFLGIALVVQLPLTIAYLTYWKKAVEEATDYESSYL